MASRMGVPMTVKEELHKLIDALDDIEAAEVLAQMRWLLSDGDTLSDEALELRRGMTYDIRLSGDAEAYLRRLDEAAQERVRFRLA
jgi:hypothetical protein